MSDESRSESTHRADNERPSVPRAIIHKQILDRAERDPDATMQAIADDISGVTVATVERVLEEYGDPCAETHSSTAATESATTATDGGAASDPGRIATDDRDRSGGSESRLESRSESESQSELKPESESEPKSESNPKTGPDDSPAETESADRTSAADDAPVPDVPAPSSLTEKQRETLRAIAERPAATQAELADELGVSSPTISQRVNSIDGFDWSNRHAFVDAVFDDSSDGRSALEAADDDDAGDNGGDGDDDADANSDGEAANAPADSDANDDETTETADERRELRERVDELARTVASLEDAVAAVRSSEQEREDERERTELRYEERAQDEDRERKQIRSREQEPEPERDRRPRAAPVEAGRSVFDDPELAHKIVHACVHSDRITEAEELRILREITCGATGPPRE